MRVGKRAPGEVEGARKVKRNVVGAVVVVDVNGGFERFFEKKEEEEVVDDDESVWI